MLDNRIKFDRKYDDEDSGLTTLYFVAPKEMLSERGYEYPDAVLMEIRIEFPLNVIFAEHAYASISPINADSLCYDWNDIYFPYDEIVELISLADLI